MTNYTKTTDFAAKDSLPSGDSGKIIRGSEFETEFDNIATAVNSKSDANNPTFTGTVTIDGHSQAPLLLTGLLSTAIQFWATPLQILLPLRQTLLLTLSLLLTTPTTWAQSAQNGMTSLLTAQPTLTALWLAQDRLRLSALAATCPLAMVTKLSSALALTYRFIMIILKAQ
jgi:hypothetical protein